MKNDKADVIADWNGDPDDLPPVLEELEEENEWFEVALERVRDGLLSMDQALATAVLMMHAEQKANTSTESEGFDDKEATVVKK